MEVFGTVAAAGSLLKLACSVGKHCCGAAEKLKSLEEARLSGKYQIASLRIVYRALSSNLHKYNIDVEKSLSKSDKDAMRDTLNDIERTADNCEKIITKLKQALQKTGNNKSELDSLRRDLHDSLNVIQSLQTAFVSHITLETYRRVSVDRSNSETQTSTASALRRTSTQSTTGLTVPRVSTASSIGSIGSSTDSTRTLRFLQCERLHSAIVKKDLPRVQRLIEEGESESEDESRKASALLLACRYRRTEIVRWLLSSHASIDLTDENGLGVLHSTIGKSEILDESRLLEVVTILTLLVKHNARVTTTEDSKQRRQPLHYCAITSNYHAASYILSVDPNVINLTDGNKKTALYHACEQSSPNEKLVKLLLEKKATFGKQNRPKLSNAPRLRPILSMLDREEKKRSLTE